MNDDFATALSRALQKTCASDPGAATAIIQSALSGRPMAEPADSENCAPCAALSAAFARKKSGISGRQFGGLPGMADLPGLSALQGMNGAAGKAKSAPVPDGARVEMRRHESAAGMRDYRLFVPSPRPDGPVGLVLMLHGCTQSPEDFAMGTQMDLAAEKAGFVVAYPGQTGQHNMQSCWNWFRPEDQTGNRGEPAILADLAADLAAEFAVPGKVFVAGLSAGGAMAAVLAETHPGLFAGVGIHSGLPAGSAHDVPSAFAAMRGQAAGRAPTIPAIVFHGTADGTVASSNANRLVPGHGVETRHEGAGRSWSRLTTPEGSELWLIDGAGHAWSGGNPAGSYADPAGPDASAEMLRFFTQTKETK